MKRASLALLCASALFAVAAARADQGLPEPASPPNVVIFLADDLGWRDVGFHGSEIATPNIDRIAREGVELDRFYAQPMCSPTRAALMTGKSPLRLGIRLAISKNETRGLPLDETILPQYLAGEGYQPLMVGKWHLGHHMPEQFPNARGFEHFYGNLTGGIGYWSHLHGGGYDWQRNGVTVRENGYTTRLIADEAIRVLAARDRTRPTFLYVAFNAPHLPNEAPLETVARYSGIADERRRMHAAMVDELDGAIGRILAALDSEGMLADTLVFFASDNGGLVREGTPRGLQMLSDLLVWMFGRPIPVLGLEFLVANVQDGGSDNAPLREGKSSPMEGGSRVPAAIWWPGHLEGGTHEGFMTVSDVLPTVLEAIGAARSIPTDLDGASQWRALRGEAVEPETRDYVTTSLRSTALYRPPWKLVDPAAPQLYDVYADPGEERDVAAQHPEVVSALVATAEAWPQGQEFEKSILDIILDPDTFGGAEHREPWADVAHERAAERESEGMRE